MIEQIISCKFSKLSREEVKARLGIREEFLRETQFYKDVFEEGRAEGETKGIAKGKLETVPLLRRLGLSNEQIAKELRATAQRRAKRFKDDVSLFRHSSFF